MKKNNKILGIVATTVLVVAISVSGCKGLEKKYNVLYADGTTAELTVDELKATFVSDVFYDGIKIDGIDVSGKTKEEAISLLSATMAEKPSEVNIKLNFDGEEYPLDLSSLKLENNAKDIVDEAFLYGRPSGDASAEELVECFSTVQGLKTTPKEYTTAFTVNTDGLSEIVHGMLDPYEQEVKEAEVGDFDVEKCEWTITDSQVGCDIDIDKAINDVKALLDSRTYTGVVTVDFEKTEPKNSAEQLKSEYGLISSSSSNTTSDDNRNENIRVTCKKLDGLVIQPGESFSFNGYIGPRTTAAGYKTAGIILNGKAEKGLGGGVCQVSSMIFQSAAKANLQIDERHPHEWPSTYCDIGTDATVDYGSADFRFTNNSEYPIAFHAFFDDDELKLTIQFYGHLFEDGSHIELSASGGKTGEDAGVVYEPAEDIPVGHSVSSHPAHPAQSAVCYKVWVDKDGNEIKRERLCGSYYPALPEHIAVGVLKEDGSFAEINPETGEVIDESETDPSESDGSSDTTPSSSGTSDTSNTTPSSSATTPSSDATSATSETSATSATSESSSEATSEATSETSAEAPTEPTEPATDA